MVGTSSISTCATFARIVVISPWVHSIANNVDLALLTVVSDYASTELHVGWYFATSDSIFPTHYGVDSYDSVTT